MKMKIIEFFKKFFKKRKEVKYPPEFAIIDYSASALRQNILDDQNKNIYYYFYDFVLDRFRRKVYRYSKAKVEALQEIRAIPIIDKTKKKSKFPIFGRIFPSEIKYTTTE